MGTGQKLILASLCVWLWLVIWPMVRGRDGLREMTWPKAIIATVATAAGLYGVWLDLWEQVARLQSHH